MPKVAAEVSFNRAVGCERRKREPSFLSDSQAMHHQIFIFLTSFIPRGHGYFWQPELFWLRAASDAIVALAYYSILIALVYFFFQRRDLTFPRIFWLFGAFIVCATTHAIEIWTLWHPNYWLSATLEIATAAISLCAAIALISLLPKALALPSLDRLKAANRDLEREIALQRSEARYRALVEDRNELICCFQADGSIGFVNEAYCRYFDKPKEELIGSRYQPTIYEEDRQKYELAFNARLKDNPASAIEYRVIVKGRVLWTQWHNRAIFDERGNFVECQSVGRDITEQKQAETQLALLNEELERRVENRTALLEAANQRQQELLAREQTARQAIQLYEDVVQNIQIGLLVWCMENPNDLSSFRSIDANPAAVELLDINLADYIGKTIDECFAIFSQDNLEILEAQAEVIRSRQPKQLNASRHDRTFAIKIFPLPGSFVGVALEDVTRNQLAEQALKASEQKYRTVVNSVKEAIFQTDKLGRWTFLNPAWEEITGFDFSECIGDHFSLYICGEPEKQRATELLEAAITGKQAYVQAEFRIHTKTGECRWLDVNIQPHLEPNGEVVGTFGTLYDITDRKQIEVALQARAEELVRVNQELSFTANRLEKRNQELARFAYIISHDLKAPLRAIANLSQWLEEDLQDCLTPDTKHQMNLLRNRVRRMEALIDGLLEYSRVGRLDSKPEEVDVARLLADIVDSLAVPPGFKITVAPEMPTFVTQSLPLQQVFTNLISNAIKHHHRSEGKINISVRELEQFYEFAVTDDGPGIPPEHHERVFFIFETLQARDKADNTGVGLSIVKKSVENQGGCITLESEVSRGSTFRFTWPK